MTHAAAPAPAAIELRAVAEMRAAVLGWYAANARDLAFRRTTDPWAILVSEVMAQQTQASRAADHWTRFMTQFPTPAALAAASPATVIRAWRGLGYNRRALALRGAAAAIVEEHEGRVPDTLDALLRLPGVGRYTARAVLAIAFNRPVAALDTNIRRVLGRGFLDPATRPGDLQARADDLVPPNLAASWTHALMDIGAAFCRPRDPRCDDCPLEARCAYRAAASVLPDTTAGPAPSAKPAIRFAATSRWLRGRILDRLRDADDGEWVRFDGPIGEHDAAAAARALAALGHEGAIEVNPTDSAGARLPAGP